MEKEKKAEARSAKAYYILLKNLEKHQPNGRGETWKSLKSSCAVVKFVMSSG